MAGSGKVRCVAGTVPALLRPVLDDTLLGES